MDQRRICIHGHFYQPPRENPWLEEIEIQDSAHPYHDWNERIVAECYARNATARILGCIDGEERIANITNNYARMSFNFGPTLLSWMAEHAGDVYAAIREADAKSRERFSGHGSAIAQAYNHIIMPLANTADKTTQVRWGIADFRSRFGRKPEGMWLPEAAVDIESLSIMAEHGIAFTILSPHQAERVRPIGGEAWTDVSDGSIDPRMPYLQPLPGDRSIAIFFYDGPISRDVAFDDMLSNGEVFANRLFDAFVHERDDDQLVHLATDGETFGHHHRHGEMALAYVLEKIDAEDGFELTNYGEFLERHPTGWEVEIKENTAWSCSHGVERWRSDCGCSSGHRREWNQGWREPLRNALDWLRDRLAEVFTQKSATLFKDPWRARDDYIDVILDRSPKNVERFLERHMSVTPRESNRTEALKLLEMQRQAMLMYTSCGWFFDDISGIETVQVIQYAGRAVQLAGELTTDEIEEQFLDMLAMAKSNIPRHRDGRRIYEKWVKPASVDLGKAAAHYAISSFFEEYPASVSIFSFEIESLDAQGADAGKDKAAVGRARITSRITLESAEFFYAVIHMGDHNISCGVRAFDEDRYTRMASDVMDIFNRGDFPGLFQSIGEHFEDGVYSLISLFRDEQRKVLDTILETTNEDAITMYRQLYENHVSLMRFITASSSRIPKALLMAGEIVINTDLKRELGREELDDETIRGLIDAAERANIELESDVLEYTLRCNLERLARRFEEEPESLDLLERLTRNVELAVEMPFYVQFQEIQNVHFRLGQTTYPEYQKQADAGDADARKWVDTFLRLAEPLKIRVA